MAQIIKHYQNDVTYNEGPFVVCDCGTRYRIEVELPGHKCPVLCDGWVYRLVEKRFKQVHLKETIVDAVDWLNGLVDLGLITRDSPMSMQ